MLLKKKEGMRIPQDKLNNALLTSKFLNAIEAGTTADERHGTLEKNLLN